MRASGSGACGVGVGVDVTTPLLWIESLWELMGDGRRMVKGIERNMLMADVVAARSADDLAPLRANPGTVRMLARMARDLLPYAYGADCDAGAAAVGASDMAPAAWLRRLLRVSLWTMIPTRGARAAGRVCGRA